MAEPAEIAARVAALLSRSESIGGRHVVVTAGGNREPIDSVRFIGNRSSGRMGIAIAAEPAGAAPASRSSRPSRGGGPPESRSWRRRRRRISSARRLRGRRRRIVMAAAMASYRAATAVNGKRPKDGETWELELTPTTDIARVLGQRRRPTRFSSRSGRSTAPRASSGSARS